MSAPEKRCGTCRHAEFFVASEDGQCHSAATSKIVVSPDYVAASGTDKEGYCWAPVDPQGALL